MKALVTGFDAFGGDKVNPSILAVRKLKRRLSGIAIHTVELPTSYARSPIVLRAAIHKSKREVEMQVAALRPLPPAPVVVRKLPQPRVLPHAIPPAASKNFAARPDQ